MIAKLPRWVWMGGWALAFVAGMVNVTGLLGFERQAITHLTGTTSLFAVAVASADGPGILHFAATIAAFVAGAVLSGLIIQDSTLRLGRRYGVALAMESALLCAAVPLLGRHSSLGTYAAACACGLQNAMVTTYSGAVLRTTHLSGMFTDLGIFLGHALRGIAVDSWRLSLCLLIITGFLGGGVAGTLLFQRLAYSALFVPAALTAGAALAYGIYRLRRTDAKSR